MVYMCSMLARQSKWNRSNPTRARGSCAAKRAQCNSQPSAAAAAMREVEDQTDPGFRRFCCKTRAIIQAFTQITVNIYMIHEFHRVGRVLVEYKYPCKTGFQSTVNICAIFQCGDYLYVSLFLEIQFDVGLFIRKLYLLVKTDFYYYSYYYSYKSHFIF